MPNNFIDDFQKLGEEEVRRRVLEGVYAEPLTSSAREWLQEQERIRKEALYMATNSRAKIKLYIEIITLSIAMVSIAVTIIFKFLK